MLLVNSAALEAVLEAVNNHIKLREGLGLETVSYILSDDDPVPLDMCVLMLQTALDKYAEANQ